MVLLKLRYETRGSSWVTMGMVLNLSWFLRDLRPPFLLPETLCYSSRVVTRELGCLSSGGGNASVRFLLLQGS